MRLSTKVREIKRMQYITKVNTDSFFSAINLSINSIQERSTKYYGKNHMMEKQELENQWGILFSHIGLQHL